MRSAESQTAGPRNKNRRPHRHLAGGAFGVLGVRRCISAGDALLMHFRRSLPTVAADGLQAPAFQSAGRWTGGRAGHGCPRGALRGRQGELGDAKGVVAARVARGAHGGPPWGLGGTRARRGLVRRISCRMHRSEAGRCTRRPRLLPAVSVCKSGDLPTCISERPARRALARSPPRGKQPCWLLPRAACLAGLPATCSRRPRRPLPSATAAAAEARSLGRRRRCRWCWAICHRHRPSRHHHSPLPRFRPCRP
jgi:hypothetical protein